jgi:hypothetical protein
LEVLMQLRHFVAILILAQLYVVPISHAQTPTPKQVTIAYTGRLLGYMRGVNPSEDKQCDGKTGVNIEMPEPDAGAIQIPCTLEEQRARGAIVVGVGDNFAPAYWARFTNSYEEATALEQTKNPGGGLPQNFMEAYRIRHTTEPVVDSRGRFTSDKVALFLQRAGYDALVPGKEDFYFGAYHLMLVARLLKTDPALSKRDKSRSHILFLGDNLFLQPTAEKSRDKEAPEEDPARYVFSRPGITPSFDGHATPWLVSLKFDIDTKKVTLPIGGELCLRTSDGKVDLNHCDKHWTPWKKQKQPGAETARWEKYQKSLRDDKTKDDGTITLQFLREVSRQDTAESGFSAEDFIQPGEYFFCLDGAVTKRSQKGKKGNEDQSKFCQALKVQEPMFCAGGDCSIGHKAQNRVYQPYTMVRRGGANVAIFGIVDENLQSYIARANASWEPDSNTRCKNVGKQCRTSIHVLAPEEGLQQALEFFAVKEASGSDYKVLLAQMAQPLADELGAHLQDPWSDEDSALRCAVGFDCSSEPVELPKLLAFQIVVTKGDEAHATPNSKLIVDAEVMHRSVVVGPRGIWDSGQTINSVSVLKIMPNEPTAGEVTISNRLMGEKRKPSPQRSGAQGICGPDLPRGVACSALARFQEAWNHTPANNAPDVSELFPQFALHALVDYRQMQDSVTQPAKSLSSAANDESSVPKSDVALLQKRDFFFDTTFKPALGTGFPPPNSVQEIVDRILWKDDLLTNRRLTGAQIKSLLKQSDKFDSEEQSAANIIPDTTKRSLLKAGMVLVKGSEGAEDHGYIKDDDLDGGTVYEVATSNHIAGGETGYPDAAKDATGDDARAPYMPVSAIVCHALQYWASPQHREGDIFQCRALTSSSADYLVSNRADDVMNVEGPFKGPLNEVRKNISAAIHSPSDPYSGPGEKRLEQYPLFDITADKASAGYQLSAADTSQANLKNFSGITNSEVSQPSSSKLDLHQHLRLLYRFRSPFDLGFEDSFDYTRQRQDSLTGPTTTSWPDNTFVIGPVFQLRGRMPWPVRHCGSAGGRNADCKKYLATYDNKYLPHFYYVFHPLDFTVQPSGTTITLSGANSSSAVVKQDRAYSLSEKIGFREEWAKDTYLETGFQWQSNRKVLSELTYPGAPAPCDLGSSQSLSDCFSDVDLTGLQIQASYRKFLQQGLYWDGKLTLPFTKSLSYSLDTKGALFANRPANRNNSALARYGVVVGNSLKIPLIGNFSLQPRFELVFYENQILHNHLFRRNFTMNLSYSFQRNSRVSLWRMMRYDSGGSGGGAGE